METLRRCGRFCLLAAFCGISLAAAQLPPVPQEGTKKARSEEEEEPATKMMPKKEAPAKKASGKADATPGNAAAPAKSELPPALADDARKRNLPPELRSFFNRQAFPFDILTTGGNVDYEIVPLIIRELPTDDVVFTKMINGQPDKGALHLQAAGVLGVKAFEEFAIDHADNFLAKKTSLPRVVVVESAIKALTAVEAWHRSALAKGERAGDAWKPVQERLLAKILSTRRELLTAFKSANQWNDADKLALDLIANFPNDAGVQFDVNKYRLERGRDKLRKENDQDYRDLRDTLAAFNQLPSAENDPVANQVKAILRDRARALARKANELSGKGDNAGALQMLRDAETFDADAKEVKDARLTMKPQILYIGVPSLPVRMSPAKAATDSERWALELLFESLLQTIPDDALGRIFRPQIAADMPSGSGEYRQFRLSKTARWPINENKETITAADVAGTLRHYRNYQSAPGFEDISLFAEDEIEDSARIKLKLTQRMIEPLPRFTFKVLPARLIPDLDSERFAKSPIGSGPYRFKGIESETADRTCAIFTANPAYSGRPDRFGLPTIREVRLYVPKPENVARDFEAGQLHLWVEPSAEAYVRTLNEPGLGTLARGYTMDANRRIWMLAINHRRPIFWKDDLRRAISHAIDREAILRESLRPAGTKFHQPLAGPFPANTWTSQANAKPLFQPELAKSLFAEALKPPQPFPIPLAMTIRFCSADIGAAQACSQIKEHLEKQSEQKLQIRLDGLSRDDFQDKVLNRQEYELAYLPYDYRDDLYWLGGLLDGNATAQSQRNFLGYLGQDSGAKTEDKRLSGVLDQIRGTTDFAKLKELMKKANDDVNARVPFAPLWQLDRLAIAHSSLDIRFDAGSPQKFPSSLDPSTLFNAIEYWRLK